MKDKSISIRISTTLHQKLMKMAQNTGLKLATYLNKTLERHTLNDNLNHENKPLNDIQWFKDQLKTRDQQINKLQQALDQEQQLNAIGQKNVENLSNQIESQRLQLEESQRPKPLIARLKAVFVAE